MELTKQQGKALRAVHTWYAGDSDQRKVFRLFGYAGVGKTTIAKELAATVTGRTLFAAFTGKAAYVMRQAGCRDATTIHSLIYHVAERGNARLLELEEELAGETHEPTREQLELEIAEEKKRIKQPWFTLNPDSELAGAQLLVIDECSMVGEQMAEDLLTFDVPILVLGDPAQLPPVGSNGFFINEKPDVLLTEIHRQAEGNPIIQMATTVREGRRLEYGSYGDSEVITVDKFCEWRDQIDPATTQVVVGRNKTRQRANARLRSGLFGEQTAAETLVVPGEKLVCLKNDHKVGLLNGSIWIVENVLRQPGTFMQLTIRSPDTDDVLEVEAHEEYFMGSEPEGFVAKAAQHFDYGYALTCHKAQGSQWQNVVVVDESRIFRSNAQRWLYTAITRASEKVTVVR